MVASKPQIRNAKYRLQRTSYRQNLVIHVVMKLRAHRGVRSIPSKAGQAGAALARAYQRVEGALCATLAREAQGSIKGVGDEDVV